MGDGTYVDLEANAQQRWRRRVRARAPNMEADAVESLDHALANARRSSGVNWARVGELRNEIAAGRYEIHGERLAVRMLVDAHLLS